MSRLTDENKEIISLLGNNESYWLSIYFKLKEYEDLEEQGLLLKLPCKIGDKMYQIEGGYVKELDAKNIDIRKENEEYIFCVEYEDCKLDNFGKIIFLTKEEAKKELKRLEAGE